MAIDIVVPTLGESVSDATIARWMKQAGEAVAQDEPIVELETDKVTLEVPSPVAGTLSKIIAKEGATVEVGAPLARVEEGGAPALSAPKNVGSDQYEISTPVAGTPSREHPLSPAVRRLVEENDIDLGKINGTGVDGRVTKADVMAALKSGMSKPATASGSPEVGALTRQMVREIDASREERVPMSKLRQIIAGRLKMAQNNAAMLTTFNEVDMTQLITMRAEYKQEFETVHNARLGFMGMFTLAAIQALRDFPAVNAEIDGTDIIYKNYYNVGVAVGTPQGLVVPVVKDAGDMSLAALESMIGDFAQRARDGKIKPDEMAGGTFTISNGGVYGSLLSTPILNPPQSGILGMHKIEKRAVVVDDQIVIRPMMYLALSYDHRIVDGREAVSFLARVRETIEDPRRLILGV